MAISNTDRQLLGLIINLDDSQKKSLLNFIRSFTSEGILERQTMEEYNIEINQAIKNVEQRNFITFEELEKEMKSS